MLKWNVPLLAPTVTSCHHHLMVPSHEEDPYHRILFLLAVVMIPVMNETMTRIAENVRPFSVDGKNLEQEQLKNSIRLVICTYQRIDG